MEPTRYACGTRIAPGLVAQDSSNFERELSGSRARGVWPGAVRAEVLNRGLRASIQYIGYMLLSTSRIKPGYLYYPTKLVG